MTTITPNELSGRDGTLGDYTGPEVIAPGHNYATVTEKITSIILTKKPPMFWVICLGLAAAICGMFMSAVAYLLFKGVGIWGIDVPVMWGFAIVNFVWWIGIGHAGTLISAILLLLRQEWRTSINRFAEAMTLFAVACAGMFPLLHLGRFWLFYWLMPYPNTMALWPQWRSPLVWDVFAVSTYGTVSLLFWYVGLIPDLATLRDRAKNKWLKIAYAIPALGWRGSAFHWQRYQAPVHPAGRPGHAAGRLGAYGREFRLHHRHRARLALDHLPALLRRRGHSLRVRDGADAGHPAPQVLPPGRLHHDEAPQRLRAADADHRLDRRLRLHDGNLHGLVQRQRLRAEHPPPVAAVRAVLVELLGADVLQHLLRAVAVVQAAAQQRRRSCSSCR